MTRTTQLFLAIFGVAVFSFAGVACLAAEPTPLECAKPMVGTADHGHTYPGATVPFGMIQLSPDTRLESWDGCSGYHYSDSAILGFSHTHLSGTGCSDLGDIRVTPLGSKIPKMEKDGYHLRFSHDNEVAKPGHYRVTLTDPKIEVDLTTTAHAGCGSVVVPRATGRATGRRFRRKGARGGAVPVPRARCPPVRGRARASAGARPCDRRCR